MDQAGRDSGLESGITARVLAVIAEVLAVDEKTIRIDSSLVDELGAASLDLVQLLWTLEEEFGRTIPDDDVDSFRTPRDVVEYISRKMSQAQDDAS